MKRSLVCFATGLLLSFTSMADVNVLIVGSTGDSRSIVANTVGSSSPFDPTSVRTYLQNILQDAGHGTVNVQVENRSSPYDLLSWFYGPAGGKTDTNTITIGLSTATSKTFTPIMYWQLNK
jgi:hypothetical protein